MDGTLIDSTRAIEQSVEVSLQFAGSPPVSRELIHSLIGKPLHDMFQEMGAPSHHREEMIQVYRDHFKKIGFDLTFLLPGAREALELAVHAGPTAIVTTKTGWYTRDLIVHLGIDHLIHTVVGFEEVSSPKPDREPVDLAISRLEEKGYASHRKSTYLIGDTMMDYGSSVNAGIQGILLRTGHGNPAEFPSGAPVMDRVDEAVEFILQAHAL